MAWSWIWAAKHLGFELVIAAPDGFRPSAEQLADFPTVTATVDAQSAVEGAHVLYTDVWVSMGKEEEAADRLKIMQPYQVNKELFQLADQEAIVMHCLPAYREKEITAELFEQQAETIFQQAENRLHAQKAVLETLALA